MWWPPTGRVIFDAFGGVVFRLEKVSLEHLLAMRCPDDGVAFNRFWSAIDVIGMRNDHSNGLLELTTRQNSNDEFDETGMRHGH